MQSNVEEAKPLNEGVGNFSIGNGTNDFNGTYKKNQQIPRPNSRHLRSLHGAITKTIPRVAQNNKTSQFDLPNMIVKKIDSEFIRPGNFNNEGSNSSYEMAYDRNLTNRLIEPWEMLPSKLDKNLIIDSGYIPSYNHLQFLPLENEVIPDDAKNVFSSSNYNNYYQNDYCDNRNHEITPTLDQDDLVKNKSTNRFFFDNWLSQNGGSADMTDTLNLNLLCKFEVI
jgi:hypothetical protein